MLRLLQLAQELRLLRLQVLGLRLVSSYLLLLLLELALLVEPGLLVLEEEILIHLLQPILPLLLALLLPIAPLLRMGRRPQHLGGPLVVYHLADSLRGVITLFLDLVLEGSVVLGGLLSLLVRKLLIVLETTLIQAVLHHLLLVLPVVPLLQVQYLLRLCLSLVDLFYSLLLFHLKHAYSVAQHHDVLLDL